MPRKTLEERFWSKVQKTASCWLWIGAITKRGGYGSFWANGKKRTNRVCWELMHGSIPSGMHVLHTCDNPRCVNPDHLFLGTNVDNVQDKMAKGRHKVPCGVEHVNAKLNEASVTKIREEWKKGGTTSRELASRFGVAHCTILAAVNRKWWKHIPG